jgi:hypothetical protein
MPPSTMSDGHRSGTVPVSDRHLTRLGDRRPEEVHIEDVKQVNGPVARRWYVRGGPRVVGLGPTMRQAQQQGLQLDQKYPHL